MIIIWLQRFYPTGFIDDAEPYYSIESLSKVENEDYDKALSYYQKAWARREDIDCEVTIQSFVLPPEYEDSETLHYTHTQPLVVMDDQGNRHIPKNPGSWSEERVHTFDKKAFDYKYFFIVYNEPVFGGVELIFELPLLDPRNKLPLRGVYANSFLGALDKVFKRT